MSFQNRGGFRLSVKDKTDNFCIQIKAIEILTTIVKQIILCIEISVAVAAFYDTRKLPKLLKLRPLIYQGLYLCGTVYNFQEVSKQTHFRLFVRFAHNRFEIVVSFRFVRHKIRLHVLVVRVAPPSGHSLDRDALLVVHLYPDVGV